MGKRSVQVTLTTGGTVYDLDTLARAILSDWPAQFREGTIQIDPSVVGTVKLGDANLSATQYGVIFNEGESESKRSNVNSLTFKERKAIGSVDAMKVNLDVDVL